MSFSQQVEKFNKKTVSKNKKFRQAVVVKLFSSVIMDSPVDTGRLRGNWRVSLDQPIKKEIERLDKSGQVAVGDVVRTSSETLVKDDVDVYLTNNLPYVARIEYEGWSKQAPQGMVRRNVQRFQELVNEELKKRG